MFLFQVVLQNNASSISTRVDSSVSEVFLKLNANDLVESYTVRIAAISEAGKGEYSSPVNLTLPLEFPMSVQPDLTDVESSAWFILLLGCLMCALLLVFSVLLYYRRKKEIEKAANSGYHSAPVGDTKYHQKQEKIGRKLVWSGRPWNSLDYESDSSIKLLKSLSSDRSTVDSNNFGSD